MYCRATGRDGIEDINYYLAYNLFRIAGILQGIMKRAVDGTASNARALEAGQRTRLMADLGWQYAQRFKQ
jgi:aminoglycoside phosphotransferase (APT) family kinase protein